jgi:hypothetical protein
MGFLDNSGDIILDAVLTDTGRMRLAKADGSFQITAFALADDEIDYSLYDSTNASGSAYYDQNIKLTPILEAFTNNASFMKSKLMSLSRNDLLYLPVIKLNELANSNKRHAASNLFIITADQTTAETTALQNVQGILNGYDPTDDAKFIRLDQGIDNSAVPPSTQLPPALVESQYIVKINNDLGNLADSYGALASTSFIDDDGIASYYFSLTAGASKVVTRNTITSSGTSTQTIAGSRGTILSLKISTSLNLRDSDSLFTELGGTTTVEGETVNYIDTFISIEGLTTGYRVDIPVRFIKLP